MAHESSVPGPERAMGAAPGVTLVMLAAMLWGTTGTAQTFSPAGLSPYWIGYFRVLIASLFFVAVVLATALRLPRGAWRQLHWPTVLLAGACMAAYNLTFFAGVKSASVAIGTALAVGSAPIWAGLMQFAVGRRLTGGWWLGTLLAVFGGIWLIVGRGGGGMTTLTGVLLCLAAGVSYALYTLLNKRLVAAADPRLVTLTVFGSGAVVALPFTWALAGPVDVSGSGWGVILFLGVVATGIAYLLFSWGLRGVGAATGVSLALMEPVTAFCLAIIVVGERPLWFAYVGLALLLLGLALVIRAELRAAVRRFSASAAPEAPGSRATTAP